MRPRCIILRSSTCVVLSILGHSGSVSLLEGSMNGPGLLRDVGVLAEMLLLLTEDGQCRPTCTWDSLMSIESQHVLTA